jgi:hypothetical protein
MAKKKAPPKKPKSKGKAQKPATTKKVAQKAKAASSAKKKSIVKAKVATKSKALAKNKTAPKRTMPTPQASISRGNQDVETVRLKPKSRVARAGTGAGDLQGISIVEDVDSESADELLEEGQAFEAGIVSGVERAGNEESEVITHEVLEDDVPKEYDDDDRP